MLCFKGLLWLLRGLWFAGLRCLTCIVVFVDGLFNARGLLVGVGGVGLMLQAYG